MVGVDLNNCWLFAGTKNHQGYGQKTIGGHTYMMHRVMYEAMKAEIPDGMVLDHLCLVKTCINPDHLEVVTSKTNTLRGTSFSANNAAKTHCINGHEFNEENTQWQMRYGNPTRKCRTCSRRHINAWYAKKKAAAI